MGYRVKTYSFEELRRISVPGAVVPSLFWLLPVGKWHPGDLNDLWHLFTNAEAGLCHDVGLVLVKDMIEDRLYSQSSLDLSSLAANLLDILPQGAEEYIPKAHRCETPGQFLLLSGAYPQPGWGLLVDTPNAPVAEFVKRLINATMDMLLEISGCDDAMMLIKRATQNFHQLQSIEKTRLLRSNVSDIEGRLHQLRFQATKFKELQTALGSSNWVVLDAVRQKLLEWGKTPLALSVCDENVLAEFKLARHIAAITEDREKHALRSILEEIESTDEKARDLLSRKANKQGFGKIVKLWTGLKGTVPASNMIVPWAATRYPELLRQFKQEIQTALEKTEKQIGAVTIEASQEEEDKKEAIRKHDEKKHQVHLNFRSAFREATICQWDWGPRFLVSAEVFCHKNGIVSTKEGIWCQVLT